MLQGSVDAFDAFDAFNAVDALNALNALNTVDAVDALSYSPRILPLGHAGHTCNTLCRGDRPMDIDTVKPRQPMDAAGRLPGLTVMYTTSCPMGRMAGSGVSRADRCESRITRKPSPRPPPLPPQPVSS